MKKASVTFTLIFLMVELATSWSIWSNQPSHGLVDVYAFSFIRYETERLLPWTIVTVILLGVFCLATNLLHRAKAEG